MPANAWAIPIAVGERVHAGATSDRVGRGSSNQDPITRGCMTAQERRIDDTMLIREAQRGDRAAFEELVRHYDQAVLRLALHLTGSEHDAQDVYQDAFLKAYKNIGSFRFECSFYTWIYRIVTNLCLDHLRKKQVRKEDAPVAKDASGGECDLRERGRDARGAHGIRAQALPRIEAADRGRDFAYHGRDRQEHSVPRHAEAAGGAGGRSMSRRFEVAAKSQEFDQTIALMKGA